jgi:hypothetical protein
MFNFLLKFLTDVQIWKLEENLLFLILAPFVGGYQTFVLDDFCSNDTFKLQVYHLTDGVRRGFVFYIAFG